MVRYFVVLSYEWSRKGILFAKDPVEVQNEVQATRLAGKLAATSAGAVAFSRRGDPTTGEYEDAEVLARYGIVPDIDGYPVAQTGTG